jgi:hypothetical protein
LGCKASAERLRLRQEKIDQMKMFDLEKARKIVAEEQAKTLAAGNPIVYNDPKLNTVLVREYANGKRERFTGGLRQ